MPIGEEEEITKRCKLLFFFVAPPSARAFLPFPTLNPSLASHEFGQIAEVGILLWQLNEAVDRATDVGHVPTAPTVYGQRLWPPAAPGRFLVDLTLTIHDPFVPSTAGESLPSVKLRPPQGCSFTL